MAKFTSKAARAFEPAIDGEDGLPPHTFFMTSALGFQLLKSPMRDANCTAEKGREHPSTVPNREEARVPHEC
jgi:hypothetical protein